VAGASPAGSHPGHCPAGAAAAAEMAPDPVVRQFAKWSWRRLCWRPS
jgi:hypothetical protein